MPPSTAMVNLNRKLESKDLSQLSEKELDRRQKRSLIIYVVLLLIVSASLLVRIFLSYSKGGYEGPDYLLALPLVAMAAIFFVDRHEKAKKEFKRRAQQAES